MGRRVLFASLLLLALLAGAAAFLILRGESDPDGGTAGGVQAAEEAPGPEAPARPPASRPGSALPRGTLAGRVVDHAGHGVEGASVEAQGPLPRTVRAGPAGVFRLDDLVPGDYVLFAASGLFASEPLGPIPLGPGEDLRDLTLVLESGAALSGVVLDAHDRKPVGKAYLSAGASSATADEKGEFRLTGLPGGKLVLFASAEGYVPRTSEVELVRGRERTGAEVHLDRAARVFGKVTAQDGQPVSGAEVVAARYGFAARLSALSPVAMTAPDGTFSGSVPPGRMQLVARALGWAEARTEELELAPGEEREANLQLGSGGQVFGQVRDAEGAGVPGCRVESFDTVHGRTTAQAVSGPGGQYWLGGVAPAIYLVVASCDGGRAESSGISVAEGAQVQVDLTLGVGVIAGRVLDAAGKPVAGALIAARPDGSAAPESPSASSRADGSFELRGLAAGPHFLSATAPQGRAEKAGVPAGARDVVLSLGSGDLVGRVVGDRGEPVSDFTVYAEPEQIDSGGKPRSQRFLSSTGEFRLALAPGRYSLKVGAIGYTPATVPGVEVRGGGGGGGGGGHVRVQLARGGTVRGRTVDPQGQPVAGVRVATQPSMLFAYARAAPVPAGASAVSDAQGNFTLTGVPTGNRVRLFAAKEGWAQRGPAFATSSAEGDSPPVEIRLSPDSRAQMAEREFAGVGMTLTARPDGIQIVEVFEGGPAREAGLRPGDVVQLVDGVPAQGHLNDVVSRIRGVVGTPVTLQVRREGRVFTVSIPRATVKF